jgi:hypothetical protein
VLNGPCNTLCDPDKAEGKEGKVKGEIEIPNLSDENDVEEVDVS